MSKLGKLLKNPQRNDFYLIGETAYHHAGDFEFMKKIVDDLLDIGVDALKFHIMLNIDNFATPYQVEYEDIGKWLFTLKQWKDLLSYVQDRGVDIIILPDEIEAVDFVIDNTEKFNIAGMEIHAASLNESFMLERMNDFEGVRVIGIGGSTLEEINYALGKIENKKYDNLLLMFGIQNYPTDYTKIKLKNIRKLKELYGFEVGYADHTSFDNKNNAFISAGGYFMGARVIEKHYSHQPGVKRNDYESAASREQLAELKRLLEVSSRAMGEADFSLNKEELAYGKTGIGKKGIVAARDISKGTKLNKDMVAFKLTNVSSMMKQHFIEIIDQFKAGIDLKKNELLDYDKLAKIKADCTE